MCFETSNVRLSFPPNPESDDSNFYRKGLTLSTPTLGWARMQTTNTVLSDRHHEPQDQSANTKLNRQYNPDLNFGLGLGLGLG